jgi:hypothetical protein
MWPHSHYKSFSVSLHTCWINKSKTTGRFRLSGSIRNVDKIYLFVKYALESSILCQCVPQFNTGSLASRLPQQCWVNIWIYDKVRTKDGDFHFHYINIFSMPFSWHFQFHGKIPSPISMSDKIDPLLRLFSDRISFLWACLLLCKVYLIISHLSCSEHSFPNLKFHKYKSTIFLSSKLDFVICHKKIQSTNNSFNSVPLSSTLNYSAMAFLHFHTIFLTNASTQIIRSSLNPLF